MEAQVAARASVSGSVVEGRKGIRRWAYWLTIAGLCLPLYDLVSQLCRNYSHALDLHGEYAVTLLLASFSHESLMALVGLTLLVWFVYYPKRIRFLLALLALPAVLGPYARYSGFLLPIEVMLSFSALAVVVGALLTVDPREYWQNSTISQQVLMFIAHSLAFASICDRVLYIGWEVCVQLSFYWAAITAALFMARSRLGWVMMLAWALYSLFAGDWLSSGSLQFVLLVALIALLLTRPVIQWYFPPRVSSAPV